ncbi:MAG: terpene cyclase/mutase family protein [Planctomycetaceae bacterium]|nr:terpene cyclase/mutase family protein [Planctomycetaceae bacterium]
MSSLKLIMLATAFVGTDGSPSSPEAEVRAAIEHSIPYIEEQGVAWIEAKDCVSCHRTGTMTWSLAAAKQQGFKVSDQLDEWLTWSLDSSLATNDKGKLVGSGNKEGLVQLIMTRAYVDETDSRREAFSKFAEIMTGDQQTDGSWKPGGQLPSQKRPLEETTAVTTMWITLALTDPLTAAASPDVISNAMQYIRSQPAGVSTEWYAVRLLLARQLDDQKMLAETVEQLQAAQRDDGGWGWLVEEQSDALGTGLALYALLQAGSGDQNTIDRAVQFLIASQQPDGSWPVKGTKQKKRDGIEETATYWGTTWAVIALTGYHGTLSP